MSGTRHPLVRLVETAVYAPIGLALLVREQIPMLAERGKTDTETRVRVARMVGEFAVKAGRKEVERRLAGRNRPGANAAPSASDSSAPSQAAQAPTSGSATTEATASSATHLTNHDAEPAPLASDLAIPGYDSLAASQVVDRLESLSVDELDAVRRYEVHGRRRRTILNRIEQLSAR